MKMEGKIQALTNEKEQYTIQTDMAKILGNMIKSLINGQDNQNKNIEADNKRDWPHLACFDIPEVPSIMYDGSMQFKKDMHIVDGEEWTVEGEWLNGVPHGVCIVDSE